MIKKKKISYYREKYNAYNKKHIFLISIPFLSVAILMDESVHRIPISVADLFTSYDKF